MKRIRRLLQQPERPSAAWMPLLSAAILVVTAGIALASWQTQPAQAAQAPAASPAPLKKVAPVLLAQARQPNEQPQAGNPYRKWLNEDVAYIISDQERTAFQALTTDAEREQFITQFWLRRDPTPNTPENEFKDEHYRRIAYANEHFAPASGLPGWKTDRGRIYITYGPPDEIEDHSAGGVYHRPPEEGGGTISAVPFQQWRYRYIDSIGNNIVIEFVDPAKTGEFRMTSDPWEKDAARPELEAGLPPSALQIPESVSLTTSPEMSHGTVFEGDPNVAVSITSDRKMLVGITLPPVAGNYDVVGETVDSVNRKINNFRNNSKGGQLYERPFDMTPGDYTLKILIRDNNTGVMSTSTVLFFVK